MSFTIRPYAPGDAPAMAQLYYDAVRVVGRRAYSAAQVAAWAPEPSPPSSVHACASDGRTTFVATDAAGEVVGYADLEADGHLDHLYCRPDAAGQGVGAALVDAILSRAAEQGLRGVHVEASEIARPLLERKGFQVLERRNFILRGVPIHNYRMAWRR